MSKVVKRFGIIMLMAFIIALVAPFVLDLALNNDETTVASAYIIPTGRGETEAPDSGTGRGSYEAPDSGTGRSSSSGPDGDEDGDDDGRSGYTPPPAGSGRKSY